MPEFFIESKKIEYRDKTDVLVIGGGPGGIAAAIAAARHGMKTKIIEKGVMLGGLATAGHVCLFEPLCDGQGRQVTGGIAEEMLYRSIEYSYNTLPSHWKKGVTYVENPENTAGLEEQVYMKEKGRYCTIFNIPAFALALEESVLKQNIKILYDTLFCEPIMAGNSCTGVIVENLSGRYAISCKMVIDGTGFSTAFQRAGGECVPYKGNHFTFECLDTDFEKMKKAIETGKMRHAIHWRILGWNPVFDDPNAPNEYSGLTAEDINRYALDSHRVALNYLQQNQRPDYALLSLPSMVQIRMTRRIRGRYEMKTEDVFKRMEDSVGCVSDWRKPGPVYEVPYRCLIDKKIDNIMAVGRNIAAQDDIWDIMRCYPGAITSGQAAGTAAAIAIKNKIGLGEVNQDQLQKTLSKDGVIIHR